MSVLKQYNTGTSTWDTIVVGQQGEPGIETGLVAPTNTSVLWMDTADAGSQVAVPSGGSTGQVLAKTSATDYATQWRDVTGQGNAVINGGFDIWQRGTSIPVGSAFVYAADRWFCYRQSLSMGMTVSRQAAIAPNTFYSARVQRDAGNTSTSALWFEYNAESSSTAIFAGQTVTLSFWAKAGANYSAAGNILAMNLVTGTGTDQRIAAGITGAISTYVDKVLTTTPQRFSVTVNVPANATQVCFQFVYTPTGTAGSADFYEIGGVQLEVGSSPTPFKRAGNTFAGELAACQRYYYRWNGNSTVTNGFGAGISSTVIRMSYFPPVPMRVGPTSIDYLNLQTFDGVSALSNPTAAISYSQPESTNVALTYGSGVTQYRPYFPSFAGVGYIGFSAEL